MMAPLYDEDLAAQEPSLTPTPRRIAPMSVLANGLINDTYAVINWEHVARAFRDDY